MSDTIFALATAPGRAAVAILRLSGPRVAEALKALAGDLPQPRAAALKVLRSAAGARLDQSLVLWFPAPNSYTGEDAAELHLHGGVAVVDAVSHALLALDLRLAEPGEFTRRAFENGKLDLTQAEAVADLVDAETEAQRRQALAQLDGALSQRHQAWREGLLEILMTLEAGVDFPDEELPEDLAARARPQLARLTEALDAAIGEAGRGELVRDAYRIAIVGAPNAGKSSLLNSIAARDAAIVTAQPGTTRDVIEVALVLEGYKLLLADTAGVRIARDQIEAEGVRRARAWGQSANLRLWVVDASASSGEWLKAQDLVQPGDVLLLNKQDLPAGSDAAAASAWATARDMEIVRLSLDSTGSRQLVLDTLRRRVVQDLTGSDFPAATRRRHREQLEEAASHLHRALQSVDAGAELAAEDVRLAGRALSRITGVIDAEAVLGRIFSSFCIGK